MSDSSPPSRPPQGGGDPWSAFGYLVAGVAVYGGLGWGLSVWLHAQWLIPVGIIAGAVLGLVLVVYQTGVFSGGVPSGPPSSTVTPDPPPDRDNQSTHQSENDRTQGLPPGQSSDDRGDSE